MNNTDALLIEKIYFKDKNGKNKINFRKVKNLNNDELEYLVKNKCLIPGIEISKEINNKDWKGVLTFDKIWNGLQDDYRQDNINIEFDIKYVLED